MIGRAGSAAQYPTWLQPLPGDHEKRDFANIRLSARFPYRKDGEGTGMTRLLVAAASLGLMVSAAGACGFKHSAHADIDQTVVASVSVDEALPMSMPQADIANDKAPGVTVEEIEE